MSNLKNPENKNIKTKISIVGAGAVGSNIAYSLLLKNVATEIALWDVNSGLVEAELLDIKHGLPEMGTCKIFAGTYQDIQDSNVVVVTAGRSRKPGETRLDMIKENLKIADSIIKNFEKFDNNNTIIVVSNPVDVLTFRFCQALSSQNNLIFGTGCVLDTSRLICCLSEHFDCETKDIQTHVIGEHGDSQVVVWSKTKICGLPIEEYCEKNKIKFSQEEKTQIETKVKKMGSAIISGKNKTHFGISTCVCHLIEELLSNQEACENISTPLTGEYGLQNVALSLPTIFCQNKISKKIVWDDLTPDELQKLEKSAAALKIF